LRSGAWKYRRECERAYCTSLLFDSRWTASASAERARNNLKNLSLELPRNRLVVITGLSARARARSPSTRCIAEGQRRYVESLSAYARQFLSDGKARRRPDRGPVARSAIEQKAASHNPRSTVGTVTEIHDYLRLLYARVGTPYCRRHNLALQAQTVAQMVDTCSRCPRTRSS